MSTYIVADEIMFQGYRVAILTTDVPATVLGDFEDGINAGTLFENDKWKCSDCNEEAEIRHLHDCKQYKPPEKGGKGGETREKVEESAYDCALSDVERVAKEYARGGLLRLSDLAKLCTTLRESEDQ